MASKPSLPPPQVILSKQEACRFLLTYHFLLPPRQLAGKDGAIAVMRRLGCIQYDPVNIVGWNPDLVLQARLSDYTAQMLDDLLYTDRVFWDGFDKVQSIYLTTDWPNFTRRRAHHRENPRFPTDEPQRLRPLVLQKIRENGPLSSLDLENQTRVDGFWGLPISAERAAMEDLYNMGYLGIHHRVGTRRYFDLVENLLPVTLVEMPDPFATYEDYLAWHVVRRIGGLGLASPRSGEHCLGILGSKSNGRLTTMHRLIESGDLLHVMVGDAGERSLLMRASDMPVLEQALNSSPPAPDVTFLAPLDNLLWHRDMLRWIFDFDYTWEVYLPADKRRYGHYVLPVLYGEKFIARAELAYMRRQNALVLRGWWWEAGQPASSDIQAAITAGLGHFIRYLQAERFLVQGQATLDPVIQQIAGDEIAVWG